MTTPLPVDLGALDSLDAISLSSIQQEAAFLTRKDRKYIVPTAAIGEIVASIDRSARVLEIHGRRSFDYVTPYFDTETFTAYRAALHRRPNRFKVRNRLYTDSGLCLTEVKIQNNRGHTVKHRMSHDADILLRLNDSERSWLTSMPQVAPHAWALQHCMTTRYHRMTLVLAGGSGRVTIDRDLAFSLPGGDPVGMEQLVIVETKGAGKPTSVDRLLWHHGFRPVSISKFACGLSLLVPSLPANRWHRTRIRLQQVRGSACSTAPEPCHSVSDVPSGCGRGLPPWSSVPQPEESPVRHPAR